MKQTATYSPQTTKMSEFTGIEYLQIELATSFGLSKDDWDVRIQWTKANESELEKLANIAYEPARFYAALQAYRKAQFGQPTGFAISLDATASGIQILSCLVECEDSARLCNVIPSSPTEDHRENAYAELYKSMCAHSGENMSLTADAVKQSIMTSFYGSEAEPKKAFGTGKLLEIYYETLENDAPGAWALNEAVKALWDPSAKSYSWVLPDNFHVNTPIMATTQYCLDVMETSVVVQVKENLPQKQGKSLCPNIAHSIDGMIFREVSRRCNYDIDIVSKLTEALLEHKHPWGSSKTRSKDKLTMVLWDHYKHTGFLSARIIECLDRKNLGLVNADAVLKLLKSMPEKPFPVLGVHDCFRVHPNYGNDLRRQYNRVLSEIAASNLLQDIVTQITGTACTIVKSGSISHMILESDYALS